MDNNYLIIIIVGLFFVFALVGYLIDMLKNNKIDKNEELPNIKLIEVEEVKIDTNEIPEIPIKKENNETDEADDLLINYDKNINE